MVPELSSERCFFWGVSWIRLTGPLVCQHLLGNEVWTVRYWLQVTRSARARSAFPTEIYIRLVLLNTCRKHLPSVSQSSSLPRTCRTGHKNKGSSELHTYRAVYVFYVTRINWIYYMYLKLDMTYIWSDVDLYLRLTYFQEGQLEIWI